MTPAAFLALVRSTSSPAAPVPSERAYSAVQEGHAAEAFLTLHMKTGELQAVPYSALLFIEGYAAGAPAIRLIFQKLAFTLTGRDLAPVFESIRTRLAAHLFEFNAARHDPPPPGDPLITEIAAAVAQAKPANAG